MLLRLLPIFAVTALSLLPGLPSASAMQTAEVFAAPPASYQSSLNSRQPDAVPVMRTIAVEERAGVARDGDLVRVPLFFADGECPRLDDLVIVPSNGKNSAPPIPWQADDIRRGPDGGVSRVHLWFPVVIGAGERRHFQLQRRAGDAAPAVPAMRVTTTEQGQVHIETESGRVIVTARGELRSLSTRNAAWNFGEPGAFPHIELSWPASDNRPAAQLGLDRNSPVRTVEWDAGPYFTKLRVRLGRVDEGMVELVYRIPRHEREIVVTSAIFPGGRPGVTVNQNEILEGTLIAAADHRAALKRIPAGIRFSLRAEHAYAVNALSQGATGPSLLAVPLVIGGTNGVFSLGENNAWALRGQAGLDRGNEGEKETLQAFWTEIRLVPADDADPVQLWNAYRAHVQPLVAVVEEPGASVERLHASLADIVREMKPIGWRQEAGRALVLGETARMNKLLLRAPAPKEADVALLVAGAANAAAQITNHGGRKLREDEKGRAYGALDPYHITYTQSAAAAIAGLADVPPSVAATNLAMAVGVREVGGRTDPAGFPYIDCFNRTLNMQLGPVLFGLTAGAVAGQASLANFYRDLAVSPPVLAIFGRAQRPYTGAPATSADQTDYLYQAICDFWLRTTELLGRENLKLHPLLYARYTDCIDVMADLYHGVAARDKPGATGFARANFFRGQAHTHRWLGWSCSPYIRLLEEPSEDVRMGLTEAIHFTDTMKGRWKNWPDLTFYILADLLVREGMAKAVKPNLPPPPVNLVVKASAGRTELSWTPVVGAASYRIYRAEHSGGPYKWLNSPYVGQPPEPTGQPHYSDEAGGSADSYVITTVDESGRESPWPESP